MTNSKIKFWKRFAAYTIDFFIPYLLIIAFGIIYTFFDKYLDRASLTASLLIAIFLAAIIFNPVFLFLTTWKFKTTLGKYLAGLIVTNKDEVKSQSFIKLFLREVIIKGIIVQSSIFIIIDGVVAIANKEQQSLHDIILKTKVIEAKQTSLTLLTGIFFGIVLVLIGLIVGYLARINTPELTIRDLYLGSSVITEGKISKSEFLDNLTIKDLGEGIYQAEYKFSEDQTVTENLKLDQFFDWWYVSVTDYGSTENVPSTNDRPISELQDDSQKNILQLNRDENGTYLTLNSDRLPISGNVSSPAISPNGSHICYSKYESATENSAHSEYSGKVFCYEPKTSTEVELTDFKTPDALSIGLSDKYLVYSLITGEIGVVNLSSKDKTTVLKLDHFAGADPSRVMFVDNSTAIISPNDKLKFIDNKQRVIQINLNDLSYKEIAE